MVTTNIYRELFSAKHCDRYLLLIALFNCSDSPIK